MHGLTRRPGRLAAALLTAATLTAGCNTATNSADGPAVASAAGLDTKTISAGPVEVRVTPRRMDSTRAVFALDLDNHQVELTGDYTAGTTLTVTNQRWDTAAWDGDGPGGHHRTGTLTFRPTAAGASQVPSGAVVLRIGGLPAPVELRWQLD